MNMDSSALSKDNSGRIPGSLPGDAVLVIGAGHFGRRASRILAQKSDSPLFLLDRDQKTLAGIVKSGAKKIHCDGVDFLVKNFTFLSPSHIIIPAVPFHLAFEWLKSYLDDDFRINRIPAPEEIKPLLPHTWPGSEGSLLVSYADFPCPDDCPEPADYCTVTGEKREVPLYKLLGEINLCNYRVHIIRSRQLAPGLGGYRAGDLKKLEARVREQGPGMWLVGTACRCHGIVTPVEIRTTERKPTGSHAKPTP